MSVVVSIKRVTGKQKGGCGCRRSPDLNRVSNRCVCRPMAALRESSRRSMIYGVNL
jgi:hypothetical protein